MIDLHCHLLPSIDDGAADWDEALAMADLAVEQGVEQCVVTPHWTGTAGEVELVRGRLDEFRTRLREADCPLKVHAGQELILISGLISALPESRALSLAGSSYLLLETANMAGGAYLHAALFELQSHGFQVILAHPERVEAWHGNPADLWELARRGCHLQLNAGSLLGEWGPAVKKQAETLLKWGWISFLASDAHHLDKRCCRLLEARDRILRLTDTGTAERLTQSNPSRVLLDQMLPYTELEAPPRKQWWRVFG